MPRYLVVAHQTATSETLLERLRELAARDRTAEFSLLVPATHVNHLLTWEKGESQAIAEERGEKARRMLRGAGLRVGSMRVGDASPVLAILDELREHPDEHDAIILSTLPRGRSRWIEQDVYAQAARRFDLPIVRVVEGEPSPIADFDPALVMPVAREPVPDAERGTLMRLLGRVGIQHIVAVMALYLVGALVLALVYDQKFLFNDALALVVFGSLVLGLLAIERWAPSA